MPVGAGEPITMKVSPAVAFAPANLVVRATIDADAANRAIEIIAESSDFYRSSEIQLEGDKAARTTTFEFRSLPSGHLRSARDALRPSGKRGVVRQQVNVMASGGANRSTRQRRLETRVVATVVARRYSVCSRAPPPHLLRLRREVFARIDEPILLEAVLLVVQLPVAAVSASSSSCVPRSTISPCSSTRI